MKRSLFALRVPFAVALSLMLSNNVAAAAACAPEPGLVVPIVSTLAGSGLPGVDNGSAVAASFVEPEGVAIGKRGEIYVADAGANVIRVIRHGTVATFAGVWQRGETLEQGIGGFADGPANRARFNRPTGVAVGRNGAVYVADSLNHAIRKIENGLVTTISAGFTEPRSVAIDDDNTLYVADPGLGLKKLAPDGTITSTTYSDDPDVCGVSARGSGKSLEVAFTDGKGVNVVAGGAVTTVAFDDVVEPVFEQNHLGYGCGVAILDRWSLVLTDPEKDAVRFVRLPNAGPVASPAMARVIAGGLVPNSISRGGFRDGPAITSEVDMPLGIAVDHSGNIIVADSGNRRIRSIAGVDPRGPQPVDPTAGLVLPTLPPATYKVLVVGNSFDFSDGMWPDSIAGQIESSLVRDRTAVDLKECPFVFTFRLSGTAVTDLSQFVTQYYGDGQVDLIVYLLDDQNLLKEIATLTKQGKIASGAEWVGPVSVGLHELNDALAKNGTRLALVPIPDGRSISPLENNGRQRLGGDLADFYNARDPYALNYLTYAAAKAFERSIGISGAKTFHLLVPMIAAEESAHRVPFFNAEDDHPTPLGSAFIGKEIARQLELWKPWSQPSSHAR